MSLLHFLKFLEKYTKKDYTIVNHNCEMYNFKIVFKNKS